MTKIAQNKDKGNNKKQPYGWGVHSLTEQLSILKHYHALKVEALRDLAKRIEALEQKIIEETRND